MMENEGIAGVGQRAPKVLGEIATENDSRTFIRHSCFFHLLATMKVYLNREQQLIAITI